MDLSETDRRRLERATALALAWHTEQQRKGTEIPYASHLLQVAGLVLEYGGSVDQAVTGLLHDCLEDAPSREERTRRERTITRDLGEHVLKYVIDCTDTQEHERSDAKAPWKERKTRFLGHLVYAEEPSLLVIACDKLHNLTCLVRDVGRHGIGTLDRFKGENVDQVWYFESVLRAVRGHVPKELEAELTERLAAFRELLGE